jgi:hypothetical protein
VLGVATKKQAMAKIILPCISPSDILFSFACLSTDLQLRVAARGAQRCMLLGSGISPPPPPLPLQCHGLNLLKNQNQQPSTIEGARGLVNAVVIALAMLGNCITAIGPATSITPVAVFLVDWACERARTVSFRSALKRNDIVEPVHETAAGKRRRVSSSGRSRRGG